ncbi:MAG: RodZ domain-containing protein [Smithella sp.]
MFIEKTPSNNSEDLKKIREDKGLSFEDLYQRTRVRAVYLQAIENKEFNLLPLPVYSKNFIKIYAGALGIDSEPLMREYENYLNSLTNNTIQPEHPAGEQSSFVGMKGKKTYLIIAFILMAVIVAQWLISKQNESSSDIVNPAGMKTNALPDDKERGSNTNIPSSQNMGVNAVVQTKDIQQSTVKEKTSAAGVKKESRTDAEQVLPIAVTVQDASDKEGAQLSIRAIEETWLRVKPEQNPSFQVLLKAGEKFEYKAKSFEIDVGNAGGIKVKFQGKDIETLGKRGEVVHLRLP